MVFTPHTNAERRQMLDATGVAQMEDLFDDVPADVRFPELDLPCPLSELELQGELHELAERNVVVSSAPSFLGAGSYNHFIPATVDYVLQRGEFYTAYTPYQPEMSQGFLQAMFEYQTMICRLTGMEVSNASHYDGATSLAEAVLLALNEADDERSKVIMSASVHPHYRDVVSTYLTGTEANLVVPDTSGPRTMELVAQVDAQTAALVIQTPDFLGRLVDLRGVAERAREAGAMLIVMADPISLGLFQPPGAYGADIVVADGQPLGIPPAFGGPSLGIFATRRKYVRRLAGRIVGETTDVNGQRGYVLTLATREQHIRRAKATSNICTNSALGALAAAVYLATLGDRGLRRVAELCYHKSHYAAARIAELRGVQVNPDEPGVEFFKEFVIELPRPADDVNSCLREDHGIIGGVDLGRFFPGQENRLLLAVTEMNTRAQIDGLVAALSKVTAG